MNATKVVREHGSLEFLKFVPSDGITSDAVIELLNAGEGFVAGRHIWKITTEATVGPIIVAEVVEHSHVHDRDQWVDALDEPDGTAAGLVEIPEILPPLEFQLWIFGVKRKQ